MIQYVMEMIVDFVGIAYLTAYANQAYLEYSHLYHKNCTRWNRSHCLSLSSLVGNADISGNA